MTTNVDELGAVLFAATDGKLACDAINELSRLARSGDDRAKMVLARYATDGQIGHMREHACASLASSVQDPNAEFAALFQRGLSDPPLRYWSILGYINSAGRAACPELIKLAEDRNIPLMERAHAVKCLAVFSRQRFDRNLPADPGHWKESDLRISEVRAWANAGFPNGAGYLPPSRHLALDNPTTEFERLISRLERILANKRQELQDLAEPTNWLAVAEPEDIQRIKARWDLPVTYLDFVTRFSPIRVTLESVEFYNPFQLFGAAELIEAQDGYSFDPIEQRPIDDWPARLVVVASHGGDPFVLDLSKSDGNDAPVETAEYGIGAWEFSRVADSFSKFLDQLVTSCW